MECLNNLRSRHLNRQFSRHLYDNRNKSTMPLQFSHRGYLHSIYAIALTHEKSCFKVIK